MLPEVANASIPADIRAQFHCDDLGRVLFFTSPPLDANSIPEETQSLSHSLRYLADKARQKDERDKKRKAREADLQTAARERSKRTKADDESKQNWALDQKLTHVQNWSQNLAKGTDSLYQKLYENNWEEMQTVENSRLAAQQIEGSRNQRDIDNFQRARAMKKEVELSGFRWI